MNTSYWQKQTPTKPLFPNIEWSKPEQKTHAGRLMIIGGHAQGFIGVAESYDQALKSGVGEVRVTLPDSLRKSLPLNLTEANLLPSNPSGGFSKSAINGILAGVEWGNAVLLPGDVGKNSETAALYEKLVSSTEKPITITRDGIDLLTQVFSQLVERENTLLVLSFAQTQKLFKNVYYPKVLTFSMSLVSLVEVLHKFTITYPVALMVFHNDNIIVASEGRVSTTPWENPMAIWRGHVATRAASYWLWSTSKVFEASTTSLVS